MCQQNPSPSFKLRARRCRPSDSGIGLPCSIHSGEQNASFELARKRAIESNPCMLFRSLRTTAVPFKINSEPHNDPTFLPPVFWTVRVRGVLLFSPPLPPDSYLPMFDVKRVRHSRDLLAVVSDAFVDNFCRMRHYRQTQTVNIHYPVGLGFALQTPDPAYHSSSLVSSRYSNSRMFSRSIKRYKTKRPFK